MSRTVQELKKQSQVMGMRTWIFYRCSMCDYPCGYFWSSENIDEIIYDNGCYCVSGTHVRETTWDELAKNYNQPHPAVLERHEREWGFISEEVNSGTNSTG